MSYSVHHVGENVKKSTSIHCCILSPSSCRFLEFPADLPPYDPASTILLYPTSDALYLDDPRLDLSRVRTMVVIESTWVKSDIVSQHPALVGLQRVKIRQRESTFWRYQELGRQFLATLEAIYWTQEECRMRRRKEAEAAHAASDPLLADGAIDDLLYFYAFQHEVITQRYRTSSDLQPPRSWSGRGGAAPGAGEHK